MQAPEIRDVLQAVPMAMLLVGPGQRVLAANHAASVLFGISLEGRSCNAFLRHPDFLDGLEACLRERRRGTARIVLTGTPSETHLALSFTPILAEEGHCALVAFDDLSALEHAVAMRRDFVANVSHELRTPLTALVGFIETLRGAARDDPAARDRFLGIMEREAGRMIRLVSDLLSLSRVEAEERRRPDEKVEVIGVLRTTLASHRDQARAAGVELVLDSEREAVTVRADADQLAQVFHNLVENAIKYGATGHLVTVRVRQLDREPVLRGPALQIEVIDKGEGIDALHLPRLTERFYRVDSDRSRQKGGTGLGLAIVKHIVNRHRGRFRIESEVGKGSRFIVVLPAG
ncbi:MAG: two-component sensor histidine kinase [Rhodobacteraceae bacterium]|jgi:two-component system phosphate regulon sensor histidine kinase PhoR|uniref:ATP-binding protein n=1 Tax=Albidovulum sp. TaxID=1872424 RepID=UPI001D9C1FC1|nr:ATP-binding protein [uncultured Defluviimonas sp.]MCB2125302.1 two-component sensor histidine kinase [Paracoccaceae bacterium]MCC0068335.1 two-component sensor histidine kinase [Paracoccaceae bacterium]